MKIEKHHIDYFLDITAEVCPMTFVKTRLKIEKMSPGEVLEIRLKGAEPLQNVPESITELGHSILSLHPEDGSGERQTADVVHRLIIKKS
jgi:TusA-related sulfurtransferase